MRVGARVVAGLVVAVAVVFGWSPHVAGQSGHPRPNDFQVEWKRRTDPFQRPGLEGWVSNPSGFRVGSMLLKVQILDADNQVSGERKVWVYGHVPAGGRAFFVVPLQPDDRANYRIIVDSFDVISREGP
jgi:hypothetical protein